MTSPPQPRLADGRQRRPKAEIATGFQQSPPPYLSLEDEVDDAMLQGVNFASGGSGILETTGPTVISLSKQIVSFESVRCNLERKAVQFLLESLGLTDIVDVLPIYVGDDRTDEDAFKVLREEDRGYGILVSSVPKETNAHYSLRDPSEVMEFLKSLVRWKKSDIATHRFT